MKRRLGFSILEVLISIAPAAPGFASPPKWPVTIVTALSAATFPFSGSFAVTDGSAALGCSGGTFVDLPAGFQPPTEGRIAKVFTCVTGGSGTFTANFQPIGGKPGPGDANGNWNITNADGDFAGLHGHGRFSVIFDFPTLSAEETLSGVLHYDP